MAEWPMTKILVVDDEEHIRDALRRALTMDGYEVIQAPDGEEGERLFRESLPDLVITDIFMPKKEGIDMLKGLLADFPGMKAIVISGGGRMLDGDDLQFLLKVAEGAVAVRAIKKPFELDEMVSLIRSLL
jgi:DNA-binding NtrC family response regulator